MSGGVAVVVDGVAAEVHHPHVRAEAGGEVGVARVVAAPRPPPLLVNTAACRILQTIIIIIMAEVVSKCIACG